MIISDRLRVGVTTSVECLTVDYINFLLGLLSIQSMKQYGWLCERALRNHFAWHRLECHRRHKPNLNIKAIQPEIQSTYGSLAHMDSLCIAHRMKSDEADQIESIYLKVVYKSAKYNTLAISNLISSLESLELGQNGVNGYLVQFIKENKVEQTIFCYK